MQIQKLNIKNTNNSGGFYNASFNKNSVSKCANETISPQKYSNSALAFSGNFRAQQLIQKKFVQKLLDKLNLEEYADDYLTMLFRQGKLSRKQVTQIAIDTPGIMSDADLKFFIEQKIPLTEVDTSEIITRRLLNSRIRQISESDDLYLGNKDRILKAELEKLVNIPKNKEMIILTGLPGAGKSTYIDSFYKDDYFVGDIDNIKKLFPDYEIRKRDNSLHNISRFILQNEIIPKVLKSKKNIIIPTTGVSEYIDRLSIPAKQNGYKVRIKHLKVDKLTSMERTMARYKEQGRFVDPYFIATRAPHMDSQLFDFIDSKNIDGIEILVFDKKLNNYRSCVIK